MRKRFDGISPWLGFVGAGLALVAAGATSAQSGAQPAPASAQQSALPPPTSYADVADHAVDAATIIDARIRRVRVVEAARAPGLPPQLVRFYVEAEVNAVLFGSDSVARRVAYVLDQPRLPNGKPPKIRRPRVLLFARPVTNAAQLQLVTPGAQMPWTEGNAITARAIAAELARGNVPPAITGVTQAFHVPGTIAGESETQIFLGTNTGNPVSLTILRRPEQAPRWAVAYGEIVDESASTPARRTIGWYRLACGLPARLPAAALSGVAPGDRRQVAVDYALVQESVGACDRSAVPVAAPAPQPPQR